MKDNWLHNDHGQISIDLFTPFTPITIFQLKKCALLWTLLPYYALLDFFQNRDHRAVLLLLLIVYHVLTSKMWNLKQAQHSKNGLKCRCQRSLTENLVSIRWERISFVRLCQFCSHRITTLWFAGCSISVDFLFLFVHGLFYFIKADAWAPLWGYIPKMIPQFSQKWIICSGVKGHIVLNCLSFCKSISVSWWLKVSKNIQLRVKTDSVLPFFVCILLFHAYRQLVIFQQVGCGFQTHMVVEV